MGLFERYLAEKTASEYKSGRITRSELLRRLFVITGSMVSALALALTLGCMEDQGHTVTGAPPQTTPSVSPPSTSAGAPYPTLTATALPTSATLPALTPTPTSTASSTSTPNGASIQAGDITFQDSGADLMGYLARPAGDGPHPAVLVIHENRGLLPHFPDVARRLAQEGYVALALDLLSRDGGTASLGANAGSALSRASDDRLVGDMNAAVRYLQGLPFVRADRVGAMGFCFGGRMVWLLSVRNPDLKAAVPFYGQRPPLDEVQNINASVLGIYAGNDASINSGVPDLEAALKQHNIDHRLITYEGAGHAFFNDTGSRYHPASADAAWNETLSWFQQHLRE
jgi:carboxymethylenebutenolidase